MTGPIDRLDRSPPQYPNNVVFWLCQDDVRYVFNATCRCAANRPCSSERKEGGGGVASGTLNLTDRMDFLFSVLDQAPAAPETILCDTAFRERYESLVMFAFRKLQAARYHLENVDRLRAAEQSEFDEAKQRHGSSPEPGGLSFRQTTSVRIRRSANPYAFELTAFLAAIKSGLDFLATVAALHFPGITADSIIVLMKLVNKGVRGPILSEVEDCLSWLTTIRDYRHHLLHRLVMLPNVGWSMTMRGTSLAAARLPVVVPEHTPAYVPDTRHVRMMEENVPFGVTESHSFGSVTYPDGTNEVLRHELVFEPAPGHVVIEVFMTHHLDSFEKFFAAIVEALIALDFKPATLGKPQPSSA